MFPLNTILAWSINIIMNKKCNNNNIIIASRAYFLQHTLKRTILDTFGNSRNVDNQSAPGGFMRDARNSRLP
jgi:hypothetical protein